MIDQAAYQRYKNIKTQFTATKRAVRDLDKLCQKHTCSGTWTIRASIVEIEKHLLEIEKEVKTTI